MSGGAPRALVLFDVDGTLIERGDPAHLAAIDRGVHAAFPASANISVRQVDFDGKVERQIVRDLLGLAGVACDLPASALTPVMVAAAADYARAWAGRGGDHDLLPGVRNLLARLAADGRFALGVLTGGLEGIVRLKLERLGLSAAFPVGAFGDEVERRSDLLPLAMARAAARYGRPFAPARTVVVGDTPHDVDCAHTGGAACLAVATGRFSVEELGSAGADRVLLDVRDADVVVAALLALSGQ